METNEVINLLKDADTAICKIYDPLDTQQSVIAVAIDKIQEQSQEILNLQLALTEIQDSIGDVSGFVENLDFSIEGRRQAFGACLAVGNKIRDLDLPEITFK